MSNSILKISNIIIWVIVNTRSRNILMTSVVSPVLHFCHSPWNKKPPTLYHVWSLTSIWACLWSWPSSSHQLAMVVMMLARASEWSDANQVFCMSGMPGCGASTPLTDWSPQNEIHTCNMGSPCLPYPTLKISNTFLSILSFYPLCTYPYDPFKPVCMFSSPPLPHF